MKLTKKIIQILKHAAKFTTRDELRSAMTGVHVEIRADKLSIVATDAHTMWVWESGMTGSDNQSFTVPLDAIKVAKEGDVLYGSEPGVVMLGEKRYADTCYLGSKKAVRYGKYPDWSCVIPSDLSYWWHVVDERDVAILANALKPCANKQIQGILLDFGKGLFKARELDLEMYAQAAYGFMGKYPEDFRVVFNASFLKKVFCLKEEVTVRFESNFRSFILEKSYLGGKLTRLIMPISLWANEHENWDVPT